MRSHTKFGPNRFSRFEVFFGYKQTKRLTDKLNLYLGINSIATKACIRSIGNLEEKIYEYQKFFIQQKMFCNFTLYPEQKHPVSFNNVRIAVPQ